MLSTATINKLRDYGTMVKVKTLARVVGKLQAVRLPTVPIVAVLTRSLYYMISSAPIWSSKVRVDVRTMFELDWWLDHLPQ